MGLTYHPNTADLRSHPGISHQNDDQNQHDGKMKVLHPLGSDNANFAEPTLDDLTIIPVRVNAP